MRLFRLLSLLTLSLLVTASLYSWPYGISGRTKKHTLNGCGSCHNFGTTLTGSISGPDTVIAGQTAQFSITLTRSNHWRGGLDIASKLGTLAPGNGAQYIKLLDGELVHKDSIVFNNSITIQFDYIAPASSGTDTLYATVNVNYAGMWNWVPSRRIVVRTATGITNNDIIEGYRLEQNFPNPFNPSTKISFAIAKSGNVKLTFYDISGRFIREMVNGYRKAGSYDVEFRANGLPSGVYFYKLEAEGFSQSRKLIILK